VDPEHGARTLHESRHEPNLHPSAYPTISKDDPTALAQALLRQAETAADRAPLLAAAQVLIGEAQQADESRRGTGS